MAIFNFEMLQCCVITGTGCHRGHHISGLTACCAIVYMGAAILEQQEQLAYKESFPTTSEHEDVISEGSGEPALLCNLVRITLLTNSKFLSG